MNNNYPRKIEKEFEQKFELLRDAKDFAVSKNGTYKKLGVKNYIVTYIDFMSNIVTTGRKYYVIDKNMKLHHQVITKVRHIKYNHLSMLDGFDGEFTHIGTMTLDLLCEVSNVDKPETAKIKKELAEKENKRYNEISLKEKQDKRNMFISMLVKK